MFQFKKQEIDSGLDLDHRWLRFLKIGAVSVFESVRLVSYEGEPTMLIYFRGVGLDENYQARLSRLSNSSTTPLMYLVTLMWVFLYFILTKILIKEYIIRNAEFEKKWQKKWPFAADIFLSVRREKKLKEIGI